MQTTVSYEKRFVPVLYDAVFRSIFLPVGGERRLRREAIARLGIEPGMRVLELGCGTGSFTKLLLEAGATVTAIDGSSSMLARARVKAAGAEFARADLQALTFDEGARYDVIFMAFVLHELLPGVRHDVFVRAKSVLAPGGLIAIVDHAVPESGRFARAWRRMLLRLEPPTVRPVIERGYGEELRAVGLSAERTALARGTAQLVVVRPLRAPGTSSSEDSPP